MSKPNRLSERDREILDALAACQDDGNQDDDWVRPMDLGGGDGTHHSATLAKLVRYGLAETRSRGGLSRGSRLYRITPYGQAIVWQQQDEWQDVDNPTTCERLNKN